MNKQKIMSKSNIITVHTKDDNLEIVIEFLKSLKLKFEVNQEDEYDKEFVSMIKEGDEDIKYGRGKKINLDELDELWK